MNPLAYPNQDSLIVDLDLTVRGPNVPLHVVLGGLVATDAVAASPGSTPAPAGTPSPAAGVRAGTRAAVATTGTLATTGTATSSTVATRFTPITVPFVASNVSHVDNYETVEFVAPVAGQYRIEVTAPRWDVCPYDNGYATNLALAWSKG